MMIQNILHHSLHFRSCPVLQYLNERRADTNHGQWIPKNMPVLLLPTCRRPGHMRHPWLWSVLANDEGCCRYSNRYGRYRGHLIELLSAVRSRGVGAVDHTAGFTDGQRIRRGTGEPLESARCHLRRRGFLHRFAIFLGRFFAFCAHFTSGRESWITSLGYVQKAVVGMSAVRDEICSDCFIRSDQTRVPTIVARVEVIHGPASCRPRRVRQCVGTTTVL